MENLRSGPALLVGTGVAQAGRSRSGSANMGGFSQDFTTIESYIGQEEPVIAEHQCPREDAVEQKNLAPPRRYKSMFNRIGV